MPRTALPTLALIATGGTIAGAAASATDVAGYTAGALGADALLAAVPQLGEVANIRAEQLFNLDSKDMGPAQWLAIAQRVQALAQDDAIDGIVITHGTDTLEETAAFLALTLATTKPVVLTAAMRPATALSADGPMNLYEAVSVAAHGESIGRGVLVSFGGDIHAALGLSKHHTQRIAAFANDTTGPIGRSHPVRYFAPVPTGRTTRFPMPADAAALPRVDILYVAAGTSPDLLDAATHLGARGIVLTLPGNGSMPTAWEETIRRTAATGIPVIRASRASAGGVVPKAQDPDWGTHAAGGLPASQARVALMLALTSPNSTPLDRLFASQ
ncbi:asparaginase [Azoarcus sp. KH32C]|uniref:asparaginase n=1 Tax=Azoarcus sp. KH32C TaxID=748247 RepID=UPI0002386CE6|nr:asparaginase [Azoarcus sp. KH32C]BAL26558.1 L-asparaginase II precursor [Azoarcus sp. KH32C]